MHWEKVMVIRLGPELEAAVNEQAQRKGVPPEVLALRPCRTDSLPQLGTRPVVANGLGLTAAVAETKAADFEALFPLLAETPDIYPTWKALVAAAGVLGKRVHDVGWWQFAMSTG